MDSLPFFICQILCIFILLFCFRYHPYLIVFFYLVFVLHFPQFLSLFIQIIFFYFIPYLSVFLYFPFFIYLSHSFFLFLIFIFFPSYRFDVSFGGGVVDVFLLFSCLFHSFSFILLVPLLFLSSLLPSFLPSCHFLPFRYSVFLFSFSVQTFYKYALREAYAA